jgi:hypothetical protein
MTAICSAVNSNGIYTPDASFSPDSNTIYVDPQFCTPFACDSIASTGGDFTISASSPCLATNSPCGQLIGALGVGCAGRLFEVGPGKDYTFIQNAIDATSGPGDTVVVFPGTYAGFGNTNLTFNGKNIAMRSAFGPEVTTIDCGGTSGGIIFENNEDSTAVMNGFTILNAAPVAALSTGQLAIPTAFGEGIRIYNSSPTIQNCVIRLCASNGVRIENDSSPEFVGCSINDNSGAFNGGGVLISGWGSPSFTDCQFVGNSAVRGGGIHNASNVNATFTGCLIANNTAIDGEGGGMLCSGTATMIDCRVAGNSAVEYGGGISVPDFESPADLTLIGTVVTGNHSGMGGGGIYFERDISATNTTISGNSASAEGGGIYIPDSAFGTFNRVILWGNCASSSGGEGWVAYDGNASFVCSDVNTADLVDVNQDISYDSATIYVDPLFCNPSVCDSLPSSSGSYGLDNDSPCQPDSTQCGSLIGALPVTCTGITIVIGGPDGDYDKIQDGIDATTEDGDTVLVTADTWTGTRNTELDFGGRNIVLKSADGPGATVIDGGGAVRGIIFQSGENPGAVVDGFTFTRGDSSLPGGSAMLIKNSSEPTIKNCIFKENGGDLGVVRVEGAGMSLQATTVEANEKIGVYFAGAIPSTVDQCDISGNGDWGLVIDASSVEVSNTDINGNNGGGTLITDTGAPIWPPYVTGPDAAPAFLATNCVSDSPSVITNPSCFVNVNWSGNRNNTSSGGGVRVYAGVPQDVFEITFIGCLFSGNMTSVNGGGIAIEGFTTQFSILPTFESCTIAANSASGEGGGIYMGATVESGWEPALASFTQTLLWGNCNPGGTSGEAYVAANNTLDFGCSGIVTSGVQTDGDAAGTGLLMTNLTDTLAAPNDIPPETPLFCSYPRSYQSTGCDVSPTQDGDFSPTRESVADPSKNTCGLLLGAKEPVDCQATGIGDSPTLPRKTVLHYPAPNPFNPVTTIRFDLVDRAYVSLRIYDVKGRLIRTLADHEMPGAEHRATWDGTDNRGSQVASGIYFVRLETGRVAQTRKVVLLK